MFDFIRVHQLDLMLLLCGACAVMTILLLFTRFLSGSRKMILILMEVIAFFLLWFDRSAYIYAGDTSHTGYIMVRVSNFMVFFLTSAIIWGANLYIGDWLKNEGKIETIPKRLIVARLMSVAGMMLAVVASFTDLYYYFDEANRYHRGQGFLVAYIIPVLCPIIQFTVVRDHRKAFGNLIYRSMIMYIFVPIICGIIQIFTYGISIVNMSLVAVSVSLYIFMYLDLNNRVMHAYEIEIRTMQREQDRMQRLFDQTANAFVYAVEKKDEYKKGNSVRVAEYARKIAQQAGKSEEDCKKVYYGALLHDVGLIGIPDDVIEKETGSDRTDHEAGRQKTLIGEEILSSIREYPYLAQGAHYSHERYNGTGYPEGLKGNDIPEIARIIAVADAFVSMTTKKRYRDELPYFVAREAFVKGSGEIYDPVFAEIMVKIIDSEVNDKTLTDDVQIESRISCSKYRENVSRGISVEEDINRISFDLICPDDKDSSFCAPSIVLFDSYDGRTHSDEKAIEAYHYLEYGEIWFDRYSVTTGARNIAERELAGNEPEAAMLYDKTKSYEIIAGRYADHLKLVMRSPGYAKEVIVALPSRSKAAYIGLTGENCTLINISIDPVGKKTGPDDIPVIAKPLSYIDHLESDLKNVQIDRWRSASTDGIEIEGKIRIGFHTMSLPGAELIWHCPYIVLFSSADGTVGGPDYQEYQMIKLNGEDDSEGKPCTNRFVMKKSPDFPGWDKWKEKNRKGMECEIFAERKGGQIIIRTQNLGISLENRTTGIDEDKKVYIAITGDQVALTDIRVS